jgi:hypothetical protein
MKFTSILFTLAACLFLSESTLAIPAPRRCRALCRAAKKVGSGIKKAATVVKKAATSKVGKLVLGGVAMATGMGGVYAAAKLANKAVDVAKSK